MIYCKLDSAYGYYSEPKKTVVVVDEVDDAEANACLCGLGVKVVRGQRLHWGPREHKEFFMAKVQAWVTSVERLVTDAESQPKHYAVLSNSLQYEWSYLQIVQPNCDISFPHLCDL